MRIRKLKIEDREQAAGLWLSIFGDSEAFTSWYFTERFCPEHSFAAFDGDLLVAMTLGRPTCISIAGETLDALLISGVSTLPEYRGRGLMHGLVGMQIDHAKQNGFSCCYLHPVSESLYTSLGFRNGTDALRIHSDPQRQHAPFLLSEKTDVAAMQAVYDELLLKHDGMQLRDEKEWRLLLEDYAADGLHIMIAYADRRPVGYVCYQDDGSVPELFALCSEAYEQLLGEAANRMDLQLSAIVPTDCGVPGERVYSMQYLVFDNSFSLPLRNGFCRLTY